VAQGRKLDSQLAKRLQHGQAGGELALLAVDHDLQRTGHGRILSTHLQRDAAGAVV
jgi:hypothetical protein